MAEDEGQIVKFRLSNSAARTDFHKIMTKLSRDSISQQAEIRTALPNTGERVIPDAEGNSSNFQVHFARYEYAKRFVNRDSAILDYGCGTGYGLSHLAQFTSESCIGIDKPESIEYARSRYPRENVKFVAGDLASPTGRYGEFDLIVSFDVIEHVSSMDAYLENIAAQLRNTDSIALISTPWSFRRNNLFPLHNPYHMCELTVNEFFNQLDPLFQIDDILLTLGMMAQVRLKGSKSNCLRTMSISLSGDHVIALEESIEHLSNRVEWLETQALEIESLRRRIGSSEEEVLLPREADARELAPAEFSLQELKAGSRISRHFVAKSHNLSALDVHLTSYNRLTGSEIRLSLYRHKDRVACITLPGVLVSESRPCRFLFPPIPDSEDSAFSAVLEIPADSYHSPIGVWCDRHKEPLLQEYYRRYRWDGAPRYTTTTELISAQQASQASGVNTEHSAEAPSNHYSWNERRGSVELPPADERPWSSEASPIEKAFLSLRHYGLAATWSELIGYVKWRFK